MIMTVGPSIMIDSTAKIKQAMSAIQSSDNKPSMRACARRETRAACSICVREREPRVNFRLFGRVCQSSRGHSAAHHLDAVTREPVEDFEEEEADKEEDNGALIVVLEDGQREQRLGDGEPASFLQSLLQGTGVFSRCCISPSEKRVRLTSISIRRRSPRKTAWIALPSMTV